MIEVRPDWRPAPSEPREPKPLKKTQGFRTSPKYLRDEEFGGRCQMGWFTNASGTSVFCSGELDPCHILPKQALRRRDLSERIVFDPRNGIALCRRHHERNDRGVERVPRNLLPPAVHDFAREHNLTDLLDKLFPATERTP